MLSASTFDDCTHIVLGPTGSGLLEILLNPLIFYNVLPYFSISDVLRLAATSRSLRSLIYNTAGSLRHLDLTRVKAAQPLDDELSQSHSWRAQLSDNVTEDDYYSSPLRRILGTLKHQDILQNVQTLILDGLSVTAELCSEIINNSSYSVRLLSIRDTRNLNHSLLCGALRYACRTSRPDDVPRLQALYVFGSRELPDRPDPAQTSRAHHSLSATLNERSQRQLSSSLRKDGDAWWDKKGRIIGKAVAQEWASCLMACEGLIVFDAVLCKGPRHINSTAKLSLPRTEEPRVATFALPPCQKCNAAPEGVLDRSSPRHDLPLLSPPPLLSSSISSAVTPRSRDEAFVARCADCLLERYCISCHSWWCEECYSPFRESDGSSLGRLDGNKAPITKSCWECGINCRACIEATQFACKRCNGGYCIVHNEGSTLEYCDWCVCRGRGRSRNHL